MSLTEGEILILEEHVGHDDFVRVATSLGWQRQRVQEGDGERISFQEIWTTPDSAGVINYIDDPTTMTRQVWLRGANLDELMFEVCRRLPAYEPDELIEMAVEAKGHDEAVDAILRVAAGFRRPDPRVVSLFEHYMAADSPLLRQATLQAIGYRRWPEAMGLIETSVRDDPDEKVRAFAATILDNPSQD